MIKIAIFASGTGSNARKIIEYLDGHTQIEVGLILSNRTNAKVLDLADEYGIHKRVISKDNFKDKGFTIGILESFNISYVILAGFLWLIPEYMIESYHRKIINIHPSLLPKYGGKGMYGMNVHRAVKANNEIESGISIHYVNSEFDEGEIIFQSKCTLEQNDSPETIAKKVLELEHKHFPRIIEKIILNT